MKNDEKKIEYTGYLSMGWDGEFYLTTNDNIEHDLSREVHDIFQYQHLGDKKKVEIIIREIV